jgi:hypothetical protein
LSDPASSLGLRIVVVGGEPIRPAKLIKPLFDAAISAFHSHNEPAAMDAAIGRLTAQGHGRASTLRRLLAEQRFDLLGGRNLVAPYRASVKWNPADERCVTGELRWVLEGGERRFSGELFEALPRTTHL